MFTGIVSHIGTITAIETLPQGRRFQISADLDYSTLLIGASIAHSGVCLTVTEINAASERYTVEAWEEALRLTTAGHIDGKAEITAITGEGDATRFVLRAPEPLAKFIAPKGSVALDGTSLTVNRVSEAHFDVLLIAHSLSVTTWGTRDTGDDVNLEVDTMARYAARLLETR